MRRGDSERLIMAAIGQTYEILFWAVVSPLTACSQYRGVVAPMSTPCSKGTAWYEITSPAAGAQGRPLVSRES